MIASLATGLVDTSGLVWTNRDFANYWLASRLVLDNQVMGLFNGHDIYFAHMQQAFGPDYPWHSWSYPPHFLLLIWPFGYLPYTISMVAFLLLTLLIYLHAASLAFRRYPEFPAILLLPFIVSNLLAGQNGFLTAALLLYGLSLRFTRPLLAGIAIGLLTVKPQLGILLPLLLLFERKWTVIASATLTTLSIVSLSAWVFGVDSWMGYIGNTLPYQRLVMTDGTGDFLSMMPSPFGALRQMGFEGPVTMALHAIMALLAFAAFLKVHFFTNNPDYRAANLLFATFLISPYSLSYDLGALVVLAATLYGAGHDSAWRKSAAMAVAATPLLYTIEVQTVVPLKLFVLLIGWSVLFQLVFAEQRRQSASI